MNKPTVKLGLLLFPVFVIHATSFIEAYSFAGQTNKPVAMFVFGDSEFEPGNNNYIDIAADGRANYPPYGETFFNYSTGRFCDGRIVPDFAALYMNLPLWRAYLEPGTHNFTVGANFASAGAEVLSNSTSGPINLDTQLSYFKDVVSLLTEQLGDEAAKKLISEAVYMSGLGGVDYISFLASYPDATEAEMKVLVNNVISKTVNATKELYELGARKFAFQNIGALGCHPGVKQDYNITDPKECMEIYQVLSIMHNDALSNVTQELENELIGFKYLIFDLFTSQLNRSIYPEKYGFKVGDIACCGSGSHRADGCGRSATYELCSDPNEYVYFDGGHNTEACDIQLAELLWNGTTDVTWPMNLRQLYELDISTEASPLLADE